MPLDELPLLPEEAIEFRGIVRAETAPEDELLRRRDGRDRVELQETEAANRFEDVVRRAVEELRVDSDSACLLESDDVGA
jgi:hypothetical protein